MSMDLTQADRDELRGQDWMRSLELPEHGAMPMALNRAGTLFSPLCRCGFVGAVWRTKPNAQEEADAHNAEYRKEEIA